jgi:hypothetical protein
VAVPEGFVPDKLLKSRSEGSKSKNQQQDRFQGMKTKKEAKRIPRTNPFLISADKKRF